MVTLLGLLDGIKKKTELELKVRDSWIMILDSTNQKFVKVQFFTNSFFQNMLFLYQSRFKWMRLNDERKKINGMFWLILNFDEIH